MPATKSVERVGKREIREDSVIPNELAPRSRSRSRKKSEKSPAHATPPAAIKTEPGLSPSPSNVHKTSVSLQNHTKEEPEASPDEYITQPQVIAARETETGLPGRRMKRDILGKDSSRRRPAAQSSAEKSAATFSEDASTATSAARSQEHPIENQRARNALIHPLTSLYLGIFLMIATVSYYSVLGAWSSGLLQLSSITTANSNRLGRPQAPSYIALAKPALGPVGDVCSSCILQPDLLECLYAVSVTTDREDVLWSVLLDDLDLELATLKGSITQANVTQAKQQVQRARSRLTNERRQALEGLRNMYHGPESCVASVVVATKRGIEEFGDRAWANRFTRDRKSSTLSSSPPDVASLSPAQMMQWRNQTACLSQLKRASDLGRPGAARIDKQIKLETDAVESLTGMAFDLEHMTVFRDKDKDAFLDRIFKIVQILYRSNAGNSKGIVAHWQNM
ncbi:hypothetical protein ABEF95_004673 [Exophiala dermatitidis]